MVAIEDDPSQSSSIRQSENIVTSADGGDKLEAVCLQKRVPKSSLPVTGCAVILLAVAPLAYLHRLSILRSQCYFTNFQLLGEPLYSTVEYLSLSITHIALK